MNVAETIAIAREWVEQYGCHLPGYCASHLMGSLSTLPHDAPFPSYRDVDIAIVSSEPSIGDDDILEVSYHGLIIECGFYDVELYHRAETLLAHPGLAPHLAVNSVLHDPNGLIGAVQPIIARDYMHRHWVVERCEAEKREALDVLKLLEQAETIDDSMIALYMLVGMPLCGLLAVAMLQVPTHRGCLALAHKVLWHCKRPELHEALLDLLGCATLSRTQVEHWLEPAATAFDRAVAVKRSPSPFGFKLQPYIRPYLVEGARELIEAGLHREAMWWLGLGYFVCNAAIQNDGNVDERHYYQAQFHTFLGSLATETTAERQARAIRARYLTDVLFALSDELITYNPLVVN